jgi:type I restriction enzyme M protein
MAQKRGKTSGVAPVEAEEKDVEVPEPADGDVEDAAIRDGFILDFVSGADQLADSAKEQVRQRIARALFHEYGFSVDDMERDFSVNVGGKRRRATWLFLNRELRTPQKIFVGS